MNNKSGKKHKRKQPKNKKKNQHTTTTSQSKKKTKSGGGQPSGKNSNNEELTRPLLQKEQPNLKNQPVAPPIPNSPKNVKPFGLNALLAPSKCSIL